MERNVTLDVSVLGNISTTYVNRIIEEERIRSADKYKQIKELKSTLKNGG